jgi:hypothetical protein
MRDVPELTFRGALSVLGHYDRPVLDRLNTALGGAVMVGGAVALTGSVAAPAVALAAIWGWVDQKNEALGLVRKLMDKISDHRAAARGYDRTRVIAAAHTILVASSVVHAFRREVGKSVFDSLEITEKELATLLAGSSDRSASESVYDSPVPMPSSRRGFAQNLGYVRQWQRQFAIALLEFCSGLGAGGAVRDVEAARLADDALTHYRIEYQALAAKVPEFLVWTLLNESGATQNLVKVTHEDVRRALDDQVLAMSRLESLLTAVCGTVPDHVSALHRAARAGLDEPVVMRDAAAMSVLADIRFPLVHEIFVQPGYCLDEMGSGSRIADEHWWRAVPRQDDLDLRLAAHLISPEATRLPLLVLGHPGAGKSLLMKVLAARLPADQYTTVYAPLRHVSSTAPVYEQVEQALKRETNGRVDWPGLVRQSHGTTLVVLLDGLDEMLQATDRDRADYLHDVAEFQWREAAQGRPVVVFVTSRTLVADRVDVPSGTTVLKLAEFDRDQIERWRQVWNAVNRVAIDAGKVRELTEDAVARQQDLARQPLLLLVLALYSAEPSFPAIDDGLSKTALYRTLFDNFTKREATKMSRAASPDEQLERLSVAALGMFNRGRQHVTDAELAADMAVLAPDGDSEQRLVAQFFFVHTAEANLGTDRARRSYEFLHATFSEYLVAREVVATLVDTADSTVGRRGERAPDDDRLFALLSHDCVAVRGPILDFLGDLLAEVSSDDRERITQTIVVLLAGARRRQGSGRYAEYRPTETDHIRAITAYTANLVLLAILADERGIFPIADLPKDAWSWDLMLDLWRAGLNTDSWHALLGTIDRKHGVLRLSDRFSYVAGLDSEIRYADLVRDHELAATLRIGSAIREGFDNDHRITYGSIANAEHAELLGHLVSLLLFGRVAPEPPEIDHRLAELLARTFHQEDFVTQLVCVVLKQQPSVVSEDIVRVLVAYLLDQDCRDTYAFIAAMGANPDLHHEFPQLLDAERYVGRRGTELMLRGTIELTEAEHLRTLLNALPPEDPAKAVAALLEDIQWRTGA